MINNHNNNNSNYILDIAPFNIKMIKSALHEFKNIYVHTIEISAKPNTKWHTTDYNPVAQELLVVG